MRPTQNRETLSNVKTYTGFLLLIASAIPASAQTTEPPKDAAQFDAMETRLFQLYRQANYAEAIKVAEDMLKVRPKDAGTMYNMACLQCLSGRKDAALEWFEKSVSHGWCDATHTERDPDFATIRGDARFKQIVEKARQALAERVAKPVWKTHIPKGHDAAKPCGLIVALHAEMSNPADMIAAWAPVADKMGMIVVAPEAPQRLDEGRCQWTASSDSEKLVSAVLDAVRKEYKIDDARTVLTGFSDGGWMTFRMAADKPGAFRGLIPVAGHTANISASAFKRDSLKDVRAFIMIGGREPAAALSGNRTVRRMLESAGATVTLETYPGVGHEFPKERDKELTRALEWVLGSEKPASP